MNNEELQGKAVQYALGTMPETEVETFEDHLRDDRVLQQLVHEWQEVNEFDAKECPQVEVPFQLYSEIVGEIGDPQKESVASVAGGSANSGLASLFQWGGWAAAACIAVAFALVGLADNEGDSKPEQKRESLVAGIVLKEMGKPGAKRFPSVGEGDGREGRMIELAELAEAYWDSRDTTDEGESTGGFTVFDPEFEIGFIAVENLPDRSDGKSFHVWARSDGAEQPVRAGSLPVGKSSFGMFYFDISANDEIDTKDENLSFFVTEETESDPQTPEGPVVLSGI